MSKTNLRLGILILGLATAFIHLSLNLGGLQLIMLLNGVGYLVLTGLTYLEPAQVRPYRTLLHYGFMAYAVATIAAYFFTYPTPPWNVLGLVTKGIELVLIVFLWMHLKAK